MFFRFQSQAKSVTEQKRFPFAPDNDSTSEELGEARGGPAASASGLRPDVEQVSGW